MRKKTVIQVLMIFLIVLISLLFYLKYFKKKPKSLVKNMFNEQIYPNSSSANYINNINYVSTDTKGNEYEITAEQAEIDINNPDIMYLENVIAYIYLKDKDTVTITSDYGKYNSENSDTIFSKNVIVLYPSHKITGEYLDFSFLSNLGTISINVIYNGEKTRLFADRVEMNIATKDTKIFMHDDTKKVLTEGTK